MAGSSGGAARAQGTAKSHAKAKDRNPAQLVSRLQQRGLRVEQRLSSDNAQCATHSYGLVREYFRETKCTALFRALFEVQDERRNVVLVAVAWVDMPGSEQARAFKRLVDRDGTGNITELSRETGRYRNVRFTGDHYVSAHEDVTVINAQAEPVGRSRAAVTLAERVAGAVLDP